MKIAVYQFNPTIGAVKANADKLLEAIEKAKAKQADLFVCPELALCGYPPEDLLFTNNFQSLIEEQLQRFIGITGITLLVPLPFYDNGNIYNSVVVIQNGKIIKRYDKQALPNYEVFDDKRYFTPGRTGCVFNCAGVNVGVVICEDMWSSQPITQTHKDGADFICIINASPFEEYKHERRVNTLKDRHNETKLPLLYVNCVGGQDEVVYDGGSFMLNAEGAICYQAETFKEELYFIDYKDKNNISALKINCPEYEERVYNALMLGVRDYVQKNGFKGVALGLSGGIDSALTLVIAVDAIGADNVTAVMMPSQYTHEISFTDARDIVNRLGVKHYHEIDISPVFTQFKNSLSDVFSGLGEDITEENLQARTRGTLLMAISNKFGYLVLTTSNKSEMATGYSTLYGDMVGGFAVLKDVLKTVVYKLSKWRNLNTEVIPARIIARSPSAELRDNQTDQDTLPEYEILDQIIRYLVEDNLATDEIIQKGFLREDVLRTSRLLKFNEYKRRQAAVGPKVTRRSFSKDWRMPITSQFEY
ncbi:MAG: NAD+ synthase [Neisseriaceae bacterium]